MWIYFNKEDGLIYTEAKTKKAIDDYVIRHVAVPHRFETKRIRRDQLAHWKVWLKLGLR